MTPFESDFGPLTPARRKALLRYKTYRGNPPSVARQLLSTLPALVVFAAFVAVAEVSVARELALFVGGLGLGAVLRQASLTWRAARNLPLLFEVIDWAKVDRLLQEHE